MIEGCPATLRTQHHDNASPLLPGDPATVLQGFREAVGTFIFEAIVMINRQLFKRHPFLASLAHKLPFILANWAT
jgi:hypothetical protein